MVGILLNGLIVGCSDWPTRQDWADKAGSSDPVQRRSAISHFRGSLYEEDLLIVADAAARDSDAAIRREAVMGFLSASGQDSLLHHWPQWSAEGKQRFVEDLFEIIRRTIPEGGEMPDGGVDEYHTGLGLLTLLCKLAKEDPALHLELERRVSVEKGAVRSRLRLWLNTHGLPRLAPSGPPT